MKDMLKSNVCFVDKKRTMILNINQKHNVFDDECHMKLLE